MRHRNRSQLRRARIRTALAGAVLAGGVAAIPVVDSIAGAADGPDAPFRSIFVTQSHVLARPTSGTAWTDLLAVANGSLGKANVGDQDSTHDTATFGAALVYARTGNEAYRDKAAAAIDAAIGTEGSNDLALARNTAGYVIAADLISLPTHDASLNSSFVSWLNKIKPRLVAVHERRANNWGTSAGAGRIAIDRYTNSADLARSTAVFKGWLGDRSAYAGFDFGDLCWQANPSAPVPVQPVGADVKGFSGDADGALSEEMRRGGCPKNPPATTNYPWGALEGAAIQAQLLAGQGGWSWSGEALARALGFLDRIGWTPTGNSRNPSWMINHGTGSRFPAPATGGRMGISIAFADWLFGPTGGGGTTGTVAPPPTTAAPTSTTRPPTSTTAGPTTTKPPTTLGPTTTTSTTRPPSTSATATFTPVEDAFVRSDAPSENTGSKGYLRVKTGSNLVRSYLKFNLSGVTGRTVVAARLVMRTTDGSDDAGRVLGASSAWTESGLTWSNAPAASAVLSTAPAPPTAGTDTTFTFTATGLLSVDQDGLVTLVLSDTESSDMAEFASRHTTTPPRLILSFG